jgi:hypothetical protein
VTAAGAAAAAGVVIVGRGNGTVAADKAGLLGTGLFARERRWFCVLAALRSQGFGGEACDIRDGTTGFF